MYMITAILHTYQNCYLFSVQDWYMKVGNLKVQNAKHPCQSNGADILRYDKSSG